MSTQLSLFDGPQVAKPVEGNRVPAREVAISQAPEPEAVSAPVMIRAEESVSLEAASHNTEDAGEQLVANKRNRYRRLTWEDIKGADPALRVKETVKANVYPRPDYEAIIASGPHGDVKLNTLIAYIVKQAYDSIAAKPQVRSAPTDEELQQYITGVHRYMDGIMEWATDKELTAAWVRRVSGRVTVLRNAQGGVQTPISALIDNQDKTILDLVYPGGWKNFAGEVRLIGANKPYGALQPGAQEAVKALKEIAKGWPVAQETWQRQGYQVARGDDIAVDYYEGKSRDGTPYVSVLIEVRAGERHHTIANVMVEGVASKTDPAVQQVTEEQVASLSGKFLLLDKRHRLAAVAETDDAVREKARELTKRTSKAVKEEGQAVEDAERVGEARRMDGEDISSEKLVETFGFKGVNFGNWMKGKNNEAERQLHLNHTYDAFLDLAEILGVPPKAMSLNGMLGLAIGAQGGGNNLAHFVAGVNEINLTRTKGAGSLAHEFGHALDHYFARLAGLARASEPWLSEHATLRATRDVTEMVDGKYVSMTKNRFEAELRPEVLAHFNGIVEAINKRPMTDEEVANRRSEQITKYSKQVDNWLAAIRRDYVRNEVPEEAFDSIAMRIRELELGDGWVMVGSNKGISPVVHELRNLYKVTTGRTYSLDETMGLQANVTHLQFLVTSKETQAEHKAQMTSTTFASNAYALDKDKGGKRYWSTDREKFARAFDAYVADKLSEKAAINSYLTRGAEHEMAAPHGEEREAINAAFSRLVDLFQVKETEQGKALFSFAGYYSEAADRRTLAQAKDMLEAGVDKEYVRQETGWFRGIDGKMRYEISDRDAKLKKPFPAKGQKFGDVFEAVFKQRAAVGQLGIQLGDILEHPALFAAYPGLAQVAISTRKGSGASYSVRTAVDPETVRVGEEETMGDVASMLLHECQHGIQQREGFAKGGSPDQFRGGENTLATPEYQHWLDEWAVAFKAELDNNLPAGALVNELRPRPQQTMLTPHEAYRRLAGEVEARNTQRRQTMTRAERRDISPDDSADVGESDVIVVFNGKEMFDAPYPANVMSHGLSISAIEKEIFRREVEWPSMPPVTVVNSVDELPFPAPRGSDGLFYEGEVYVVASQIRSQAQLQKVMAHECVLHYSLMDMLGDYGFAKLHSGIQAQKDKGDPVVVRLAEEVASLYGSLSPEDETKEIIALAGERCLDETGAIKVEYGFMKSVYAGVAGWLRDRGFKVPFSNVELQGIIHDAGQWIERDRGARDVAAVAVRQGVYSGRVMDVSGNVITQKIGRDAGAVVKHDSACLTEAVAVGDVVSIKYSGGRGVVTGRSVALQR